MTVIVFTVPGKAAPQGSKRHVGRGVLIESSREVGPWRERVAIAAHNAMRLYGCPIQAGAVRVEIDFILPRPKSAPKTRTPPAIKRPDLDKLTRAILDAITAVVIADDSQVVDLHVTKWIAECGESPEARITVSSWEMPTEARKAAS